MAAKSAYLCNYSYFSWEISSRNAGLVQQSTYCRAGLVVRQLRILVSQFRVLRTGTLFEIRPDNMYQPLAFIVKAE